MCCPRLDRVLIAAAAGLDGEAAVLAAARLAVLRGTTAYQALISVSHRRLALQLKVRWLSYLFGTRAALLPVPLSVLRRPAKAMHGCSP